MKKLIAIVFYVALPAAFSFGQTNRDGAVAPPTNPQADRVERMSKRFPAELVVLQDRNPARLSRSYCVYRSADASITIKPCQPKDRKLRLVPGFQAGAPTKP